MVRCLFEDREGDLWIGANGGLSRWRNDIFMVYGKSEGLPSDAPNTVFQDSRGRVWVGFNDAGLMQFGGRNGRRYTTREGLPDNEIFQIREAPERRSAAGHAQWHRAPGGRQIQHLQSAGRRCARKAVFDALEDARGALWLAMPGGLGMRRGRDFQHRGAGRSAADRFRRDPVPDARRRDLGRHLRQGPVAREGRQSARSTRPPTGFRATRSARCTKMARARCGSARSAAD